MIRITNREGARILIDRIGAGFCAEREGNTSCDIAPVRHFTRTYRRHHHAILNTIELLNIVPARRGYEIGKYHVNALVMEIWRIVMTTECLAQVKVNLGKIQAN
jgi:hypothetical protein